MYVNNELKNYFQNDKIKNKNKSLCSLDRRAFVWRIWTRSLVDGDNEYSSQSQPFCIHSEGLMLKLI